MTPNLGGWIHSFTLTDTITHKSGFTIYKITSIVFPRSVPEALTCLTVWKRFHDIKRLHRELCRRQKSLHLNTHIPAPTDSSFFKRFDPGVIQQRKEYILQLLDFVSQHPALYKCHAFTQFFSDGHTPGASPLHQLLPGLLKDDTDGKSAIAEICDNLDLRYDHDNLSLLDPNLDKQAEAEEAADKQQVMVEQVAKTDKSAEPEMPNKHELAQHPRSKDYARFLTPMASLESEDSDYIYEAALEFSKAVQAEVNLDYRDAHDKYKKGVELLLHGAKEDANEERKYIAKAKITKYLQRADDIYDKFLRHDASGNSRSHFQLSIDVCDGNATQCSALYLEKPWPHLAKYKVLQVLGDRVMQVLCITQPHRPTYIMKGIEKPSSNSPTQTVFLPQAIPYMVDLLSFFQSEQKIFLLLKQAEGGRLYDYVRSYSPTSIKAISLNHIFPDVAADAPQDAEAASDSSNVSVQDSGFVDALTVAVPEPPNEATDFSELVRCSQQLLNSVSHTLQESTTMKTPRAEVTIREPDALAHRPCQLPEACLKQWASELAVAIHSLHAKGIILGDLHMDNLLLGSKGQLLLTYFYQNEGFVADNYVHKAFSPLAMAGHYVAPERPLTTKSDWWSYGVILFQLLLGLSFKNAHPGNIDLYGCVQYPEDVELTDNARDLLDSLLHEVPEQRLDYEQIQRHAFFENTDWDAVLRNSYSKEAN